jgi:regulator of cell morphogenesis and NO signaling
MNFNKSMSLAEIVSHTHKAAGLFEKYRLDFCCKGKRSLDEACMEKDLSADDILYELNQLNEGIGGLQESMFLTMSAEQLVQYIILKHHFYVKQAMPTIYAHVDRVAYKHGSRFPYMIEVANLFRKVCEEMDDHMQKEELVLFPRIKELERAAFESDGKYLSDKTYITSPIEMMEMEHEEAGGLMERINELTHNYSVPNGACNTFRVALAELQEFEQDLHKHVHLENNILFPKALGYFRKLV